MTIVKLHVYLALFLFFCSVTASRAEGFFLPTDVQSYGNSPDLRNVELGKGHNSLQLTFPERLKHKCVDGVIASLNELQGSRIYGYLSTFVNQKELYSKLENDVTAQGKSGVVNLVLAGNILRDMRYSYRHSYAFVLISKTYVPQNLTKSTFAVQLSDYNSLDSFVSHCGEEYISTFTPGAFAVGAIDCETQTDWQQDKAIAELKKISGSVQNGKISGTGTLKNVFDTIKKETNAQCKLWTDAAGGVGLISKDEDSFISSLWNYVQNGTIQSATVASISFQNYENVARPGPELAFLSPLKGNISRAKDEIEKYRTRINRRVEEAEGIEALMARLDDSGGEFQKLANRKAELTSEIREIERLLKKCSSEPFKDWVGRCGSD